MNRSLRPEASYSSLFEAHNCNVHTWWAPLNRKSEVSCRTNQMTFDEFKFQLIMHSIGKLTYRFAHPMQPYNTEIDKFTKPNQTEIEKKEKRRETQYQRFECKMCKFSIHFIHMSHSHNVSFNVLCVSIYVSLNSTCTNVHLFRLQELCVSHINECVSVRCWWLAPKK